MSSTKTAPQGGQGLERGNWLAAVLLLHCVWVLLVVLPTASTPLGPLHPGVILGLGILGALTLPVNLVVAILVQRLRRRVSNSRAAAAATGAAVWVVGWALLGLLASDPDTWRSVLAALLLGGAGFGALVPTAR